jgi:hypothetical protein
LLSQRLTAIEAHIAAIAQQDASGSPSALVASHERDQLRAEARWLAALLSDPSGNLTLPGKASA